ncbi:tripartite tricarboxylate transporter substrate binding protein [Roseomonas stagni]|uniref:Tripartite tricarboxylate transporter substrate binding protein n=1 Tax=Falsiroseomonas algicola TaxID=2716930 RepID=A0A6M1LGK6_9PROT|nr:tripartite tricarboxylate transporter substrate binding protein [Falsiroseomonas algicola]NGM19159.1 tripartite tricarboxylate transporter substrate binding protein [Falsiroseomonas algicola]
MTTRRALAALALGTLAAPAVLAQPAWPRRPVRMLVGFAPGGFTDIVARGIAEQYASAFGQPFVIENRSGASGTLAADAVAKANPDGSTLLFGHSTPNAVAAALFTNLPYDPLRDFTPVAQVAVHPHLLVVPASSPHRTTESLIAAAKAQAGAVSYASSGIGSVHHLACEMLAKAAGVQLTHVPYRGSAPAMADLIAGRVDMTIDGVSAVAPQIADGKLRPLAAGTLARIARYPDLTTLREQGYGDIDAMSWVGVFGPPGLAPEIVQALSQATDRAMQAPGLQRVLEGGGSIPADRRGAAFRDFIAAEIDRYKAVLGDGRIPVT